jgi:hypothetical protein
MQSAHQDEADKQADRREGGKEIKVVLVTGQARRPIQQDK